MKEKTLDMSNIQEATKAIADIKVIGNVDAFQLLFKASSQEEGWMKSTKAMDVNGGCVLQVTTQQRNPDGSYALAEAVCFIPGRKIVDEKPWVEDGASGRKLVLAE